MSWIPAEAAVSAASYAGEMPASTAALLQRDRLLILAEFLETRIGTQGVPERIEPKKGRCRRG